LRVRENALPARAFVEAAQGIDWTTQDADDLIAAIQMAIQIDAIRLARELSEIGKERFPESAQIQKLAKIVGIAPIIKSSTGPHPKLADTARWMNAHASEYFGMWVALDGDKLLGTAKSYDELLDKFRQIDDVVITQIV